MKASKFIFISIISILFFWSCTVSNINEKLLIGNWTNGRIKSFIVNKKFSDDTTFTASNKLRLNLDSANIEANERTSLTEFKIGLRAIGPIQPGIFTANMKSEMNFKPDKTVTFLFRKGIMLNGRWKMNRKGNKVMVKDTVTNKKHTINVAEIDLSKLLIYERFPVGDLMIIYNK